MPNMRSIESSSTHRRGTLFGRIAVVFLLVLIGIAGSYILLTAYYAERYVEETTQRLHAQVAQHLIDEKFPNQKPFLPDGSVNEALFGDIMHDMMAVNRRIEVYLLDTEGTVRHSVVLDPNRMARGEIQVQLEPIEDFLAAETPPYIKGSDPRDSTKQTIFSVAPFEVGGQKGYIYITLTSQAYADVAQGLLGNYAIRTGAIALGLTFLFAIIIGLFILWYLTRHVRTIVRGAERLEAGELEARINLPAQGELTTIAHSFNRMADRLLANIEELKNTEKLRRELIANVSHDLRTPLTVIHGYVETIQMKGDNLSESDKERYIHTIIQNTEKLKKLVAELFELSKLEANQIQPQLSPIKVETLLADTYAQYQLVAQEKQLSLELEQATDSLPEVVVDVALLERVLQNLIDNAFKFTPQGGTVSLKAESQAEGVLITVADTGVGIPEEELPHIFDRFATRNRIKRNQEGSGLGLAIAQKILDLHQSHLKVMSQVNQGTAFSFILPRVVAV